MPKTIAPGVLDASDHRRIVGRHVVGELHRPAGRSDARRLDGVLHRDGQTVQRTDVVAAGHPRVGLGARCAGPLDVERDDGVDVAIEPVDAIEVELEELDRSQLAAADGRRELGRGFGGVHGRRLAHLRSRTTS